MRAVTGTILSSQPCPVAKVSRVLARFVEESPSGLLSSDAATYLRTAIEAAAELNCFRRDLRRLQVGGESERTHRHKPVEEEEARWEPKAAEEEDGRWEPKAEEEYGRWEPKAAAEEEEYGRWEPTAEEDEEYAMTIPAAVEKTSSKKKGSREEKRDIAAPHGDVQSPAGEKRRKKKEKRVKEEIETEYAIEEQGKKALGGALQGMVSQEGIDSERKAKKKKKKYMKQEDEEVMGAKEAERKMVHVGVAENGLAGEEKKRKKTKHAEVKEVKKEVVDDGDLGSDKKRKKKRGRDGDNGNDTELVEHTKKKQRK
ncbi:uncharacterized protein [Lolium perenne]|uniref:uncharacterized protein n=1 Tax=Lolium perenne TaxID=4522 RepID=UPI0021F5B60E|nr:uncharacterized protein LOC127341387 [Lolium perenne]